MKSVFGIVSLCLCLSALGAREIALTFDDAPRLSTTYLSGKERTHRLIHALAQADVQTFFFCNSGNLETDEGKKRLEAYAHAGHRIANHTHGHMDLHGVGSDTFLENVDEGTRLLSSLPGFVKWFRYPFLHEGKDTATRDAVRTGLKNRGYRNAYVTIDNYDWYMDRLLQRALQAGAKVNWNRLKSTYIKVLLEASLFYDKIAVDNLGRSPRHVLLLHESDLAALFIDDFAREARNTGWKIITPERAFEDPIAETEPDTLFLGQGRVVALAKLAGYKGPTSKWEDEALLDSLFRRERVFIYPGATNAVSPRPIHP